MTADGLGPATDGTVERSTRPSGTVTVERDDDQQKQDRFELSKVARGRIICRHRVENGLFEVNEAFAGVILAWLDATHAEPSK